MKRIIYGILTFAPILALAQTQPNLGGLQSLVVQISHIISLVIPIIFALAIIFFFWGLVQFIRGAGDPKKRDEGRGIMIYGIIAIAIMILIYGIVNYLAGTLGIQPTTTPGGGLPQVPGLQ